MFGRLHDLLHLHTRDTPKHRVRDYFRACENGWAEPVRRLLEQDVDPNIRDVNGSTGLTIACTHGHSELVSVLLAGGANPLLANRTRWLPIHCAAMNGRLDCVRLLVPAMRDINARGLCNRTAFHLACANDHIAVAELLIRRGADTDLLDDCKRNAISRVSDPLDRDHLETLVLALYAPPSVVPQAISAPALLPVPRRDPEPSPSSISASVDESANDKDSSNQCKVCFESEIDALLLPCKHYCCCYHCSQLLTTCPICRTSIGERLNFYRS